MGDEFWIDVLGEQHWYRVDQIVTVEPGDLREMQILEGRDYVTLFTCTPVGVNSHRLLVRGERIPALPPRWERCRAMCRRDSPGGCSRSRVEPLLPRSWYSGRLVVPAVRAMLRTSGRDDSEA